MQIGARVGFRVLHLAAGHDQRAFAKLDIQVVGREPGYGKRDAIGILVDFLDVVGGIGRLGHIGRKRPIHQIRNPVKTNGCTVKRRKVKTAHCILS